MQTKPTERELLDDALGDRFLDEPQLISSEPYGDGAIAGFSVLESAATAFDEPSAEGTTTTNWYVDTSGRRVEQETGLVLGDPDKPEARIWLHPADPRLPALAPASFDYSAAVLLERMGLQLTGSPHLLAYRAGKRAVFRMRGTESDTFLKVVRPKVVEELARVHTALADAGLPVPRIIAWGQFGLIAMESAAGAALSKTVNDMSADAVLDEIDLVRTRLAGVDLQRDARASLARRVDWYSARLRAAAAGDEAFAALVEALIAELGAPMPQQRTATVHGDLHIGQLFMSEGSISGLIDVDTTGTGNPVDDEAAFIGHLVATVALREAAGFDASGIRATAFAALERWRTDELRHVLGVHIMGHAILPAGRGNVETALAMVRMGIELLARL
ncbi:phosphotransferase family protein [Agrococcus casei]|uniref:phosphotransferase family protein n=1 Tax=Agrococcus casei TaxID=343512 RepID=UPI003F92E2D7